MRAKDILSRNVIAVGPDESVATAAGLMLQNHISGLPVIDFSGELIGIVTEGDFLRRGELGTQRRRSKWLQFIVGPGRLAEEYVRAAGRKVHEVMTTNPVTVGENDSLEKVVELMERRHLNCFPVVKDGRVIGIIGRSNLLHALVNFAGDSQEQEQPSDSQIHDNIIACLDRQSWALRMNVIVKNGIAELWGPITDDRERKALIVAVENVPGVKQVHDHLAWVEPMSCIAFSSEGGPGISFAGHRRASSISR